MSKFTKGIERTLSITNSSRVFRGVSNRQGLSWKIRFLVVGVSIIACCLMASRTTYAQCAPPSILLDSISPAMLSTVSGEVLLKFDATPGCNPIVAGAAHLDGQGSCGLGTPECIGIDYAKPYGIIWDTSNVPNGQHYVYLEVYDQYDNGANYALALYVSNPPSLPDTQSPEALIQFPIDGTKLGRLNSITVEGSYADNVGVVQVDLFVNGQLYATANQSPFSILLTVKKHGNYQLQTRAIDAAGNQGLSQIVGVSK